MLEEFLARIGMESPKRRDKRISDEIKSMEVKYAKIVQERAERAERAKIQRIKEEEKNGKIFKPPSEGHIIRVKKKNQPQT